MSRYIAYEDIDYRGEKMVGQTNLFKRGVQFMIDRINEAPSIDICFCKECNKRKKNKFCLEHMKYERDDNGYCSHGERQTETDF